MRQHKLVKIKDIDDSKTIEVKSLDELFNYKLTAWDTFMSCIWYTPKRKIKDLYYDIKYGFQRMFKGYDDTDTFEFWYNFCERTSKIFDDMANHHYGYPSRMTNEEYTNRLKEMSQCLKNIMKVEQDYDSNMTLTEEYEIQEENKNKFMKLFSELFFDLWD